MIKEIIRKLKMINPWHFLWIGVLCSEIFGVLLNAAQSYLWWGFLSRDLLMIGLIDGLFVPLMVAPLVIYFVLHAEKLEELNKELQLEIAKVKQSEEKTLRESEARYRSIVEDQTEFVNRFLPDGTVTYVNDACCRYFGRKRDEIIGRSFFPTLPEGDRERVLDLLSSLSIEDPVGTIEHRLIKPDGTVVWQQWTNRAIFDENGSLIEFQAVGRDITGRKRNEQLIYAYKDRLSQLTSRLSLVEEKERRNVAVDLHDNIGQILACAHMMLRDLQKSAHGGLGKSLEEIRSLMEQSIKYTRSLTFELGTPLLYEIGLEPAVEWLGEEFQKKHGIEFSFRDDGTDKPLRDEARILIFQSVRELLTNVVKHARARNVTVTLQRKDGLIRASVEDDGIGFDVGSVCDGSYMKCGFGLFSVRERLKNIGGGLDIESEPGSSTRITLTAPLKNGQETEEEK